VGLQGGFRGSGQFLRADIAVNSVDPLGAYVGGSFISNEKLGMVFARDGYQRMQLYVERIQSSGDLRRECKVQWSTKYKTWLRRSWESIATGIAPLTMEAIGREISGTGNILGRG